MDLDLQQLFENADIEIENNLLAEATIANEDTHNKIMKLGAIHNSTMYDDYYTLKNGRRIRLSNHPAFNTRSSLNVEYGGSGDDYRWNISDEEIERIARLPDVEFKPNFTKLIPIGQYKGIDLSNLSDGQLKTWIYTAQEDYTDAWVEAYKRGIIDKETYEKPFLKMLKQKEDMLSNTKRMRTNPMKQELISMAESSIKRLKKLLNIKDAPIVKTFKLEETIQNLPNENSFSNKGSFSSSSDNIYEATAYHGTPHNFEDFSLKHISSGEGHQVHGWGLYFSLDKEIAREYKTRLGTIKSNKLESWQDKILYEIRINGFDSVVFDLKYAIKNTMNADDYVGKETDLKQFEKELAFAESLVNVEGTLFTVDVPENDVLMDEYATIPYQPFLVQQIIKSNIREIYGKYLKQFDYDAKKDIVEKICEYVEDDDSLSRDDKQHIEYTIDKLFGIDVISEEEPITPDELKNKWLTIINRYLVSQNNHLQFAQERNYEDEIIKTQQTINRTNYILSLIPDIMKLITDGDELIFFKEDMDKILNEETGKKFYERLSRYLQTKVSMKTSKTKSRYCLASMWLLKQGVQGIKYHGGLDGDCVVIFNPKRVKILSKE